MKVDRDGGGRGVPKGRKRAKLGEERKLGVESNPLGDKGGVTRINLVFETDRTSGGGLDKAELIWR